MTEVMMLLFTKIDVDITCDDNGDNEFIIVIIDDVNSVVNWWDKILSYIEIMVEINELSMVLCLVRWNNMLQSYNWWDEIICCNVVLVRWINVIMVSSFGGINIVYDDNIGELKYYL